MGHETSADMAGKASAAAAGSSRARLYAVAALLPYLIVLLGGMIHGFEGHGDRGWDIIIYVAISSLLSIILSIWGGLLIMAFRKEGRRVAPVFAALFAGGIGPLVFWGLLAAGVLR